MEVPDQGILQILSDDAKINGVACDDGNDPPSQRRFRSVDVKP